MICENPYTLELFYEMPNTRGAISQETYLELLLGAIKKALKENGADVDADYVLRVVY